MQKEEFEFPDEKDIEKYFEELKKGRYFTPTAPMPFLRDKSWYTLKVVNSRPVYTPTDKAPPEAVESLKEYMKRFSRK